MKNLFEILNEFNNIDFQLALAKTFDILFGKGWSW